MHWCKSFQTKKNVKKQELKTKQIQSRYADNHDLFFNYSFQKAAFEFAAR